MNTNRRIRVNGPNGHKSEYHCSTLLRNWQEDRMSFGFKDPAKEPLGDKTIYRVSYKGTSSDEELLASKPPGCFCAETPKELLFHHGDILAPPRHQYTVSELSYTTRDQAIPSKDILDKEGVSLRRDKTNALRRSMILAPVMDSTNGSLESCKTSRLDAYQKGASAKPETYDDECTSRLDSAFMESTRSTGYRPAPMPPIGRVQNKERFLTTKNVSVDLTGEYLKDNIDKYPLTSSECWGGFMAYKDDPMQRTKLRDEYVN